MQIFDSNTSKPKPVRFLLELEVSYIGRSRAIINAATRRAGEHIQYDINRQKKSTTTTYHHDPKTF
ncbi:hypothetical protein BofuT4_P021660.1 [Botrytis cinerea T4]|uniref:Uncharacterized protein n=1 Tax=Botryotinia fuckeliana (strain T4) TaxID=999810 RepID=G2YHB3_BOTF4|nr:hypothetical protein BofuT4_P021660.1 [Botrytis cinerea T4]